MRCTPVTTGSLGGARGEAGSAWRRGLCTGVLPVDGGGGVAGEGAGRALPGDCEREGTGVDAGGSLPGDFGAVRADLSAGGAESGTAEIGTEISGSFMDTGGAVRRAGGADAGLRMNRGIKATWRSLASGTEVATASTTKSLSEGREARSVLRKTLP
jgi:hypothetical protein